VIAQKAQNTPQERVRVLQKKLYQAAKDEHERPGEDVGNPSSITGKAGWSHIQETRRRCESACRRTNAVGKPDDRDGHVRFDEGVLETEPGQGS